VTESRSGFLHLQLSILYLPKKLLKKKFTNYLLCKILLFNSLYYIKLVKKLIDNTSCIASLIRQLLREKSLS